MKRFPTELARLQWLYQTAPKGRKEAAFKRLRDHMADLMRGCRVKKPSAASRAVPVRARAA